MKHLLRIGDLNRDQILEILDRAEELRNSAEPRDLSRKVLGLLFFQPSTRTRFGFAAAMARLGGTAINLFETKYEVGMTTAETLEDTLRSIRTYCEGFVLRHPENDAIERAAAILADVPLINAGNGTDEHPTQALIDLFAIRCHHRQLHGLRIGLIGDLKRSRAAHSLLNALRNFPPEELRLFHPEEAGPEPGLLESWPAASVPAEMKTALGDLDVLYVAGLAQRTEEPGYPASTRQRYRIGPEHLGLLRSRCLILSPLPRVDELDSGIDQTIHAGYFEQSDGARFIRMAALEAAHAGTLAG